MCKTPVFVMRYYFYLPYQKCKNCRHLDPSASRVYRCNDAECPAHTNQIIVKESAVDYASQYIQAVRKLDFAKQSDILSSVKEKGKGFEYKFKSEVQRLSKKE